MKLNRRTGSIEQLGTSRRLSEKVGLGWDTYALDSISEATSIGAELVASKARSGCAQRQKCCNVVHAGVEPR